MDKPEQPTEPDGGSGAAKEVDEELAALPAAPQRLRRVTLAVMAVTAVLSALLAWSLRGEAIYTLRDKGPIDLGNLAQAQLGPELANRHVTGHATLDGSTVIHFRRPAQGDRHDIRPVTDARHLWVEYRVPDSCAGPRFVIPSVFSGRLVPVQDVGARHRGLADALARVKGQGAPADAWLLMEGTDPPSTRWILGLVVFLLIFVVGNTYGIVRIVRKPVRG